MILLETVFSAVLRRRHTGDFLKLFAEITVTVIAGQFGDGNIIVVRKTDHPHGLMDAHMPDEVYDGSVGMLFKYVAQIAFRHGKMFGQKRNAKFFGIVRGDKFLYGSDARMARLREFAV